MLWAHRSWPHTHSTHSRTHARTHARTQVCLIYVQLLNPPPHIRNHVDKIWLASVVLRCDLQKAGPVEVFHGCDTASLFGSSLGAAFRRLNEATGIPLNLGLNEKPTRFRGWLVLLIADTLGMAEVVGTKRGFGAETKSPCWGCISNRDGIGLKKIGSFLDPLFAPFPERTPELLLFQEEFANTRPQRMPNHPNARKRKQEEAKETKKQRNKKQKRCLHGNSCRCTRDEYLQSVGVNTFNNAASYFPHLDWPLAASRDLMHVELEGNLKAHGYGLLYMILVKFKCITRDEYNRAVRKFRWDFDTERRMPVIMKANLAGRKGVLPKGSGSLPYTSGQMLQWALNSRLVLMPLLKGRSIVEKNESIPVLESRYWKCWCLHVEYFQMLLRTSYTKISLKLLDEKLCEWLTAFSKIEAYSALWIFKMHLTQHFPRDIQLWGSLRNIWCMMFERKNAEAKHSAARSNCQNTPGVIAWDWSDRSHNRLQKVLHSKLHKLQNAVKVELSATYVASSSDSLVSDGFAQVGDVVEVFSAITIQNIPLHPNSWILARFGEGVRLAQVQSIWFLEGREFIIALSIAWRENDLSQDETSGLMSLPMKALDEMWENTFYLSSLEFTVLWSCAAEKDDHIFFIEKH